MVGRRSIKKKSGEAESLGTFNRKGGATALPDGGLPSGTGSDRAADTETATIIGAGNTDEAEKFFSAFRKTAPVGQGGSRKPPAETPAPEPAPAEHPAQASAAPDHDAPEAAAPAEAPTESEFGEPPCAKPMDIGWNPEPAASDDEFASSAHDEVLRRAADSPGPGGEPNPAADPHGDAAIGEFPVGEEHRRILVEHIRKENLSLAATLEKAREWNWSTGRLSLTFGFEYEAAVAKNEADTIRRAASAAGLPPFTLDVKTDDGGERPAGAEESPRVELVRRVFRGQVIKG